MALPDDWKKLQMPLGLVAGLAALTSGTWVFLHMEFALAADLQELRQTVETRALTRDKTQLETEVLKLTLKRDFTPKQFNPIDEKLLAKYEQDLKDVKEDLKQVKASQVKK